MSQRVDESPRAALTVRRVAGYINVNEHTACRVAGHGDLPAFKVGDTWRFRPEDIDARIGQQQGAFSDSSAAPPQRKRSKRK